MKESNIWDANRYNKHADFVSNLAMPVIELLNPQENEKILDLGCGDGTLSIEIKKSNAQVKAVDLSANMVKKAKEKGIDAYIMSVTDLDFKNEFDAVFSNAVLHWVKDSQLTIENIYGVLKSEGRFIAEFGGYGNIKYLTDAFAEVFDKNKEYGEFINPWYFPTKEGYQKQLENNGFKIEYIELIQRPTPIDDISNWLDIFANGILSHLNTHQQIALKKELREILKTKIFTKKDGWVVDYVRLRVKAVKIE